MYHERASVGILSWESNKGLGEGSVVQNQICGSRSDDKVLAICSEGNTTVRLGIRNRVYLTALRVSTGRLRLETWVL